MTKHYAVRVGLVALVALPLGLGVSVANAAGAGVRSASSSVFRSVRRMAPLAWSRPQLVAGHRMDAIACQSPSLCVGYNNTGDVLVSRTPGDLRSWQVVHVDAAPIVSVSCISQSFCFGLDRQGGILTSADPAGGVSAWVLTRLSVISTDAQLPGA